ncbi:hypothetical protein NP233_g12258 [Leucocoprinus birnbaumii]|uniref:Uncharacterized protein n=1 Tax=Leucocoprinus birnbaumii TaxID=56174 RepID=A0AAD5VHE6_9AGAR|nr:hypothetical protein NP233_g12258 [Leucocoprinus birnbaumii]
MQPRQRTAIDDDASCGTAYHTPKVYPWRCGPECGLDLLLDSVSTVLEEAQLPLRPVIKASHLMEMLNAAHCYIPCIGYSIASDSALLSVILDKAACYLHSIHSRLATRLVRRINDVEMWRWSTRCILADSFFFVMDLYSDFPVVSHSIADFNQRTKAAHNTCQSAFMQVTLSGEYEEEGETLQVLVDTNRNLVEEDEVLQVDRDIDSCLGISDHILIDAPISVWTIPPGYLALKASIHLTREIIHEGTRYDVPYHHIPNFELGTFGQRCQLNVFFPRLWTPDHSKFEQPWFIKEEKRAFWYEHGIRPAIAALLGDHIASQWPPTFQTEQLRAAKSTSANPGWSTKMIPREAVGHFADAIRTKFDLDVFIDDEDRYWASQFFFLHTIRGVKDTTRHNVNQLAADLALDRFVNFSHLVTNHHLRGEWYVDVAIEISSPRHQCLQWSTQSHCSVVAEALRISNGHASRVTQLSSSKYSRDIVSHLSAVSGFRITPGPQAEGEFEAVYIQAYTTDKTLTSNNEKGHHAKFIEAKDALGQLHPPTVVSALYDI